MHAEEVRDFAQRLVCKIVDRPDAVEVFLRRTDDGYSLFVRTAPEEIGIVMGRNGRNIDALRSIVQAYGARFTRRVRLSILEAHQSAPPA